MRQPNFPEAELHGTHQTFLQIDLTNIKLYLYFFFLDFSCMNLSYAFSFLQALEILDGSTQHFFPCKMETFFDSLDFPLITFYVFWFSSAWLTLPSLFSLFLCFFAPAPSLLSYFSPDMNLFSSNRCSVQMTHQVFQEARSLNFHAKHGYSGSHGKTSYPFFLPSISVFPELTHLPPLFPLSRLNRLSRAYLDALFQPQPA
jgi:hypothetical protein